MFNSVYSGIDDAIDTSITKLNHTLKGAYNGITSSFMSNIQTATDSSVDKTDERASSKVTDGDSGDSSPELALQELTEEQGAGLRRAANNSKVIVMDANGSESKSIARSLRKLGIRAKTTPPSRLLLSPVRFGAQALAWTMRKLEPNKVGLPTSPSTTAVQNKVLQAARKHGTLPLELEDAQEPATAVSATAFTMVFLILHLARAMLHLSGARPLFDAGTIPPRPSPRSALLLVFTKERAAPFKCLNKSVALSVLFPAFTEFLLFTFSWSHLQWP
ncbi:hypothetical protein EJ110_NYTH13578 [Nymphaea thermarum]|nr:hypothetical protein EJ110_NYTH13578 [Nymphaea thermarum]